MKSLSQYITESSQNLTSDKLQTIYGSLLIDDKERLVDFKQFIDDNSTFEDIERAFWRGHYKNDVDDWFDYITDLLTVVNLTPKDIIYYYSLARSGKQMKIEVIAQVLHGLLELV